jgi:Zn-dependent M28 family amino/carboxypeptidase
MCIRAIFGIFIVFIGASSAWGDEVNMEILKQKLYQHVQVLSVDIGDRSLSYHTHLEQAAEYIKEYMKVSGYKTENQIYQMNHRDYRNVIAIKPGKRKPQEVIVIGAHYDTVLGTPGADDNASGVAGLLELARLCQDRDFNHTLKFVAFTLEEPPVFRSKHMGSRVYARRAREAGENITTMLCLESIGYYTDEEKSQSFPLPLMGYFYPNQGNFVVVIGNFTSNRLVRRVAKGINAGCSIPVETFIGPSIVPGVDFSDHASFWKYDYPAVMITDSAFCRNPHYHLASDTIDTLDFDSLAEVLKGVLHTIKALD